MSRSPKPPLGEAAKEQVKLTGTFVNNMAVGLGITGGVAPMFAYLAGSVSTGSGFGRVAGVASICIVAAVALHVAARRYIGQEMGE